MLNAGTHSFHSIGVMIIFITEALSGSFDLILVGLSIAMPIRFHSFLGCNAVKAGGKQGQTHLNTIC